ncbi:MAG: hypothetical protein J5517_00515 [Eubacterium sp.]|nr:hypothetical protein [Eubacterium sp.]
MRSLKKTTALLLSFILIISLTSCSGSSSHYSAYVKSLITANYLGRTSEYVKLTGADEGDAEALYLQNVTRLADNLSEYYTLDISGNEELAPAMVDLAKQIYGKAKFTVGETYKDNNIYYVDVSIQPIDILNQTNQEVYEYIENFNDEVAKGTYNNYTKEEYEYEFASGIIGILAGAVSEIEYRDAETVKVRIITSEDTYYIGNEDLRNIDMAILATKVEAATIGDAVED